MRCWRSNARTSPSLKTASARRSPLPKHAVRPWGGLQGLGADQIGAAELSLASKSWATAIEGLAGTAKTTTVGAIREFAEGQGYAVHGFGMTSGSVKALKEAGLEAPLSPALSPTNYPPSTDLNFGLSMSHLAGDQARQSGSENREGRRCRRIDIRR